jgi:cobalt-zinc-cadmium efflux system outer membrane protein
MFLANLCAAAMAAALIPTLAAATPLTLGQALDLAVQRSEATRGARAGARSADQASKAAGQLPDPTLQVGLENLPVTGAGAFRTTTDSMTMKRLGISQEWVSSDKRAARQAAADALASQETAMAHVAAADTRLQTALSYIDAFYAGEALKLTTLMEHHAHEEFEAARGRLASADGSSQEALALASARGMAADESDDVRQQQSAARASLQRWTGIVPDELLAVAAPALPTEDAFVDAHPAVVAKLSDIDVAQREADATSTNRRPNWSWNVSYGQRTGYSDMVSVGVSIPLQVAPSARQDRDTASKLALVEKAEAELVEARRAAAGEFQALASDAQRLQSRIERYRVAVLAPAQQRVTAAMAAYGSNQVSLATLFGARHAQVDVERKLLSLQRDLARAQVQLVFKPLQQGELQ